MNSVPDAITVDNLTKTFYIKSSFQQQIFSKGKSVVEQIRALDNISFTVKEGEVMGIIGPNGSGKSTLLRTIAGIYAPDSGFVKVKGRIAPLLQIGVGFHNELTAKENVVMYGMLLGLKKSDIKAKVNSIIEFAELQKFVNMKLKYYSNGMRLRLAFATSLQVEPDVLLVDEVLAVGDAHFKEKSFNAFMSFKEQGKTIIYTSHSIEQILQICNRVLLLHEGKMLMCSTPEETIKKYRQLIIQQK